MEHEHKFTEEYKQKLFEFGEGILSEEQMSMYDGKTGQAKFNFLALSKKSQKRLLNAYFSNQINSEKMDNLIDRLKTNQIFK